MQTTPTKDRRELVLARIGNNDDGLIRVVMWHGETRNGLPGACSIMTCLPSMWADHGARLTARQEAEAERCRANTGEPAGVEVIWPAAAKVEVAA